MKTQHQEQALYDPVRRFFTEAGYVVRGEISHCDVVAAREGADLIAIELKLTLNLSVITQAVDRQRLCKEVWIAVARPARQLRTRKWQHLLHVLKRLELGLLLVALDHPGQPVEAVLLPRMIDRTQVIRRNKVRYEQLKKEFWGRHGDRNKGGSTKVSRVTVYREQALLVAAALHTHPSATAAQLRKLGAPAKTWNILYDNHYHWFESKGKGLYALTEAGQKALCQYADLLGDLQQDQNIASQQSLSIDQTR
ncbi:MAG: DUF2161 family putative PD-(D/E)XK-type phosphodiesterase [Bacillota bacterium]|nr:DUF2161 family putative PD-(D/E)XK-type phosphodiesterase [Bacillota bacterium]